MMNRVTTCRLVYKTDDGAITFELANLVFISGEVDVIAFSTNSIDPKATKHLDSLHRKMLEDVYLYVSKCIAKCVESIKEGRSASEAFATMHNFSCIRTENWQTKLEEDTDFSGVCKSCSATLGGQLSIVVPNITQEIIEALDEV